jgi:hypothetical protein
MICLIAAVVMVFLIPTATIATSSNIYPPGDKPYGLSYSDHVKNWWIWALGIPAKENPMTDPTGDKCSTGQNVSSSVFYLAINDGGVSERTCKVPAGKGLLIPVNQVVITEAEYPGASEQDLAESARADQDGVNSLYIAIDGREYNYEELKKYRINTTEPFTVNFPPDATFGIEQPGPSKAVADGFYVITEPLTVGSHIVHFKSGIPAIAFAQDIKYNIIVE